MARPWPELSNINFQPGKSPFRIKGGAYLGTRRQYDSLVPGGYLAVANALPNGMLTAFAMQDFFASNWYDVFPMAVMDSTAIGLTERGVDSFLQDCANLQASLDASGVYRLALRAASPAVRLMPLQFIKRMVSFSHHYFSFGRSEARPLGDKVIEVVSDGLAHALADWFQRGAAYYIAALFRMSGLPAFSVEFDPVEIVDVTSPGMPLARARWRARW
ncbi:MAG: hypothetical protein IT381_16305 [Deltaproteobacteria bacterium]|nr:hypothetical protein [Deltaproteobacteria bacterium]